MWADRPQRVLEAQVECLDAVLAGTFAWPGADQMRSLFSAPRGPTLPYRLATRNDLSLGHPEHRGRCASGRERIGTYGRSPLQGRLHAEVPA